MTPTEITFIFAGGIASGALPFLLWFLIRRLIAQAAKQADHRYWRSRHLFIR